MDEEKKDSLTDKAACSGSDADNGEIGMAFNDKEITDEASSLSDAPSLDLLLYDSNSSSEKDEIDVSDYDSFLSDYKETIAKTLQMESAEKSEQADSEDEEDAPTLLKHKSPEAEEAEPKADSEPTEVSTEITEQPEELSKAEETDEEESMIEESSLESVTETGEECEQLELDLGLGSFDNETAPEEEKHEENEQVESDQTAENVTPKKTIRLHSFFETVELFVFTLVAVMLLTNFVFRHSEVEGGSMMNTLQDGDHLIISNLFYTPDYGDIVVFTSDKTGDKALVKRVVALEGDEVDFLFADGRYELYINNELVSEDYVYLGGAGHVISEVKDYVVKEGEVFVLGDHRNDSHDSRSFGAINIDRILGRVVFRFYPFGSFGSIE